MDREAGETSQLLFRDAEEHIHADVFIDIGPVDARPAAFDLSSTPLRRGGRREPGEASQGRADLVAVGQSHDEGLVVAPDRGRDAEFNRGRRTHATSLFVPDGRQRGRFGFEVPDQIACGRVPEGVAHADSLQLDVRGRRARLECLRLRSILSGRYRELDEPGYRVLIYASYLYDVGEQAEPFVRYEGRLRGWEAAEQLDPLESRKIRPPSIYAPDNQEEEWGLYWFVRGLHRLDPKIAIGKIRRLQGRSTQPGLRAARPHLREGSRIALIVTVIRCRRAARARTAAA